MKTNTNLILSVALAAVVAGVIGFYGGTKYEASRQPNLQFGLRNRNLMNGPQGSNRQGQFQNNMRPVTGEIINQDDKSLTVKMPDGSSKIVLLSDKTKINKASEASKNDLKTGETVSVFGTTNSDGSVTALDIQLNPVFRFNTQNNK